MKKTMVAMAVAVSLAFTGVAMASTNAVCVSSELVTASTPRSSLVVLTVYFPAGRRACPTMNSNGTVATTSSSARAGAASAIPITTAAAAIHDIFTSLLLTTNSFDRHRHHFQ